MEEKRTTVFIPVCLGVGMLILVIYTAMYFVSIFEKCDGRTKMHELGIVCQLAE